jgi:hypothetical protein
VARGAHGWHGIQGSSSLRTARLAAAPAVARAEALAPGEMRRVPVAGELLGAARVRGRFAALPLDAFDGAGDTLSPEEQGAYFQLLRLSYGEGRNFCRATKRDLMARLGATERRLLRILDGLVEKGLLRLLHRDNRGTLYRVLLPREAAGEPLGDDVLLGRAAANDAPPPQRPIALRRAARPSAGSGTADPVAGLAAALAAARGQVGEDAAEGARDEVRELLAEGASPRQVEAAIRAIARRRATDEGGTP